MWSPIPSQHDASDTASGQYCPNHWTEEITYLKILVFFFSLRSWKSSLLNEEKKINGIPHKQHNCYNWLLRASARTGMWPTCRAQAQQGQTTGSIPRTEETNTTQSQEGNQSPVSEQKPHLKFSGGLVHWALSLSWPLFGSWLKSMVTISKITYHSDISLKLWIHTWNVTPSSQRLLTKEVIDLEREGRC